MGQRGARSGPIGSRPVRHLVAAGRAAHGSFFRAGSRFGLGLEDGNAVIYALDGLPPGRLDLRLILGVDAVQLQQVLGEHLVQDEVLFFPLAVFAALEPFDLVENGQNVTLDLLDFADRIVGRRRGRCLGSCRGRRIRLILGLLLPLLLGKPLGLLLLILLLLLGGRRRRRCRLPRLGGTTWLLWRHCCGRGIRRKDRNLTGRRRFPRGAAFVEETGRAGGERTHRKIPGAIKDRTVLLEEVAGVVMVRGHFRHAGLLLLLMLLWRSWIGARHRAGRTVPTGLKFGDFVNQRFRATLDEDRDVPHRRLGLFLGHLLLLVPSS